MAKQSVSQELNDASCHLVQAVAILNLLAQELKPGLDEVAYGVMSLIEIANRRIWDVTS